MVASASVTTLASCHIKEILQSEVLKASSVITLVRILPLLEMLLLFQLPRPQNVVVIFRCDIRDLSLNSFLEKHKNRNNFMDLYLQLN